MGAEVKTKGERIHFVLAKSTKKQFLKYAKAHRMSVSQILRDFIQECINDENNCKAQ